jgi:hypothetical protein
MRHQPTNAVSGNNGSLLQDTCMLIKCTIFNVKPGGTYTNHSRSSRRVYLVQFPFLNDLSMQLQFHINNQIGHKVTLLVGLYKEAIVGPTLAPQKQTSLKSARHGEPEKSAL